MKDYRTWWRIGEEVSEILFCLDWPILKEVPRIEEDFVAEQLWAIRKGLA